ncbi:MAG: glutamate--tRNA ligase [Patescibacteria group bacterium]|nr:glutamate--tRNA ligase [Patescibacteria group bacterium]
MIRTRFAPSPTGYVHIGSLRTALFAFLFARHNNGKVILRVEDTDRTRLVEGAVDNLLKVMKRVGINFDEGFYLDNQNQVKERGEAGPYLQSQRLQLYQKHALELIEKGRAYYCFCSEQRLEELRKEQAALKKPPMYDRHCRNLAKEQIAEETERCRKEGRNPVIRFSMPQEGQTVLHDLIYGDITYENKILDDQVILKSDGFPTYHLAVVIDDHYMQISHVIRGEEWLPSAPKHVLLYQAFDWNAPAHAHFPLILNPDKSKLSKRQGDVAVEDFLARGYLPEALVNFVAFLGWNPKTEQEIFSMEDLIKQFDLAKINKAAAIFDINKLDWINSLYIRAKSDSELTDLLIPYWEEAIGTHTIRPFKDNKEYLEAIASLEKDRLKKLSEIGERTRYFFMEPEYAPNLLVWKKSTARETKEKLLKLYDHLNKLDTNTLIYKENLEKDLKNFILQNQFDNGSILWPLRTAMTGLDKSPGPFEVTSTLVSGLGKGEILKRLQKAINKLA